MCPAVYVETRIISYLAARPSRDLITAAHQRVTHAWWRERRSDFDLYVSQMVLDEAAAGDPEAAVRRAELWADVPLLDIGPEAVERAVVLSVSHSRRGPPPMPHTSRLPRTTEWTSS